MRTDFTASQLADPDMAASEAAIRKCVHCGFCTATCPTYVLLGDELDSPRGRIYLMKNMLEGEQAPTPEIVKHIDRCLSCLSCMTTCPSDVNYKHLVDHARAYVEQRYRRPWHERLIRGLLAAVLPYPRRFRAALGAARLVRPAVPLLRRIPALRPLAAMIALAPRDVPRAARLPDAPAAGSRGRVVLMQGCAEPVLRPGIREAAARVLGRAGFEIAFARGEACCGALVHHMGRTAQSLAAARRNVVAWERLIAEGGITAIVATASGCGTAIKDYGVLLRDDPDFAERAERVSALAKDVSELLADAPLPFVPVPAVRVAYHPPCSLQHGQKITDAPARLLEQAGFIVATPAESHLCCGSAGTYNLLQPEIAGRLAARKAGNLARLLPDVIATGNLGCAIQIGTATSIPAVHTIELLDWATGGPCPYSTPIGESAA